MFRFIDLIVVLLDDIICLLELRSECFELIFESFVYRFCRSASFCAFLLSDDLLVIEIVWI